MAKAMGRLEISTEGIDNRIPRTRTKAEPALTGLLDVADGDAYGVTFAACAAN